MEVAQEGEDGCDLGEGVFIDTVQAHQWVEDEQAGGEALDGVAQALAVGMLVQAQCGNVDEGDVELMERCGGGAGNALEAASHQMAGILCGVHQDTAGLYGREVTQRWDAGGDRDGQVEGEERFPALGFAADDAHGVAAPERWTEELGEAPGWRNRVYACPRHALDGDATVYSDVAGRADTDAVRAGC